MKWLRAALLAATALAPAPALADWFFTPATTGTGANATAVGFDSTHSGTSRCAAASTQCFASVPIDVSGTALFSAGNGGFVQQAGTWNIGTLTTITTLPALPTRGNTIGK